jgi:mono/diheme cytochrome c family protein
MTRTGAIRRFAALMSLAAFLAAFYAFQVSADPAAPPKGNPAAAKPIFTQKCVACHKADGSGGIKLTGNPTPNWKDPKTWADPKRKNVDAYLRDCITNGKVPSGMVAWGKTGQLKPQQIEDLIAYIKTTFKK